MLDDVDFSILIIIAGVGCTFGFDDVDTEIYDVYGFCDGWAGGWFLHVGWWVVGFLSSFSLDLPRIIL